MKNKIKKGMVWLFCFFTYNETAAQNTRINDHNTIGWYAFNGTFKLNKKWGLHTEYQWRRDDVIKNWQQSLLRTGVNYQVNAKLSVRAGYAWIETFNYGDIPINGFGKQFTEHRAFEMATISDKIGIAELSHRFMLEQRWIGRYANAASLKEEEFFFANRFRYMYRMQLPLNGKTIEDKTMYAAIYDEVLLGFGKNVNENVFDQNRLGILLGYRFSKNARVEGGFLSQVVQLPREVSGRNVFQYNNGLIVTANVSFDVFK